MAYFQTKNPNLGKFWRAWDWKSLVYSMTTWNISWPLGIFYDRLVIKWQSGTFWLIVSRKIWQSCCSASTMYVLPSASFSSKLFDLEIEFSKFLHRSKLFVLQNSTEIFEQYSKLESKNSNPKLIFSLIRIFLHISNGSLFIYLLHNTS
jgi:hypothetical protein